MQGVNKVESRVHTVRCGVRTLGRGEWSAHGREGSNTVGLGICGGRGGGDSRNAHYGRARDVRKVGRRGAHLGGSDAHCRAHE